MFRRLFLSEQNILAQLKSTQFNRVYSLTTGSNESQRHSLPTRPLDWKNYDLTKVVESKEDFKFVERLIPNPIVPEPPKHEIYPTPSGWVPVNADKSSKLNYYVLRTRFHNFPIYPLEREGGSRKLVKIKYIEGNIWEFDRDLRSFIEECVQENENTKLKIY